MGSSAFFATGDASHFGAQSAAKWIPGFYPQVAITIAGDKVELHSDRYDEDQLTMIWMTALANEEAHFRAQAQRAASFAMLAQ